MRWAYGAVIFLGALLLFGVEPMAAKALLPAMGGSSAVWLAALCFFQVALLLGYGYAWGLTRLAEAGGRWTAWVHAGLLAAGVAAAVVAVRRGGDVVGDGPGHPMAAVWATLALRVGLPFLLLSATTPLLQAAMARRGGGAVPYRLFALSNAGSLLALLLYPVAVEPALTLGSQRGWWAAGFAAYAVGCGWLVVEGWGGRATVLAGRRPAKTAAVGGLPDAEVPDADGAEPVSWGRRALWFGLAAAGAMQLAAVTGHLTENVAALPLLWVLPLAVYLLAFAVAFELPGVYQRGILVRLLAVMLASLGYLLSKTDVSLPIGLGIGFFLIELFAACWFCDAELFRLRPAGAKAATGFYLVIAAGGAAGTALVAMVSPVVFRANYDLPLAFALTAAAALAATWRDGWGQRVLWGVGTAGCLLLVFALHNAYERDSLVLLRNFYGSLRVKQTLLPPQAGTSRVLLHGSIQHGMQWFAPEFQAEPMTYYARDSGVGLTMRLCCGDGPRRVGVIGLGAGTMAAYGRLGDVFRFYEINPAVERLARELFSYTRESRGRVEVVEGDARLSLEREPPQGFDVLVVDAFSGDAIPVHLLTMEAMRVYQRHLRAGGVIAFHISNQYLDLQPVVAALAKNAGMEARVVNSPKRPEVGEFAARWVVVGDAGGSGLLGDEEFNLASGELRPRAGLRVWTDDYSSLLPIVRWSGGE